MEFTLTPIKDLVVIQPSVFEDDRGCFFESYNEFFFAQNGIDIKFVQDNQSISHKSVLRGLHFQIPPYSQAKLVRVIKGSVLDVAVDIRKKSDTYGQYFSIELNETNKTMLYIPEGFAHGFIAKENDTVFVYKCSNFYVKESERCILWNDPIIDIDWHERNPIISEKDKLGALLNQIDLPF
ncbi:MAG: dTDP-4-dehydrorhamnose 3,5-epimerase [Flavobacteriales bacterium]|nr:dTDP-4-dehydrorhamnose 3,5-epimerase [Flavobacteriales bacterium]